MHPPDLPRFLQALAEAVPDHFGSDIAKTLIGTLVGALVAFWFALRKDALNRRNDHRAAGHMAMTTLGRMTSDFIQVKAGIEEEKAKMLAVFPQAPLWMQLKPMPFAWGEHLRFDIKALTFIFDHKDGPEVFNKLINAEIKYHVLFTLIDQHKAIATEAQDVLAVAHPDPEQPKRVGELQASLGFARTARMQSLTDGIFKHIERDEAFYTAAHDELRKFLKTVSKGERVLTFPMPTDAERRAALS